MSTSMIHRHFTLLRSTVQSSALVTLQHRSLTKKNDKRLRKGNPEDPHEYYKWGYKPLPVQTSLDVQNPEFSIHSPKFKLPSINKGRLTRKQWRKKIVELQQSYNNSNLEKLARTRKLYVSLEEVEKEWKKSYGIIEITKLAKFNGLYRDLFDGGEDVVLETMLDVAFSDILVHRGNHIEVGQLLQPPTTVNFDVTGGSLYTIIFTNLDGHPVDGDKEIIHWMMCNMSGNDLSSGQTVYNYLPPLPWQGTGSHRLVFALFKHDSPIEVPIIDEQHALVSRTFSTQEFISSNSNLVPISLSWLQTQWDKNVTEQCKVLKDLNGEPIFDWNDYVEPKIAYLKLKQDNRELRYRNM